MATGIYLKNKKASFEFSFIEKYVAGIQLTGTEIKSIRASKVSFVDSYCIYIKDELFIRSLHIAPYEYGSYLNHDPKRDRKLLLNKRELKKLRSKSQEKGLTIIPVAMFINEKGFAKLEIALAKGKKIYDKRDDIKQRDIQREMERG